VTTNSAAYGFLKGLLLVALSLALVFIILDPIQFLRTRPAVESTPAEKTVAAVSALAGAEHRARVRAESEQTESRDSNAETRVADAPRSGPIAPDTAVTTGPHEAELQRAISLIDGGRAEDAAAVLEGILKTDPTNEQALVELAMVNLLDFRKPEAAVGLLERALDVNPKNHVVIGELVSLYEEHGQPDAGIAFFGEMAGKHPEAPEVAWGMGQMLSSQGRDSDAITWLERASTSTSDQRGRALSDLADAYSRTGQPDKAIDSYRKAIAAEEQVTRNKAEQGLPRSFGEERVSHLRMDLARELMMSGQLDRAQEILDDLRSRLPEDEGVTALLDQLKKQRAG